MIKIQTGFNPTIPLTHSRIGYDTFTINGTATASTSSTTFPEDAPLNSLTYEYWRPTAMPATWTLDAGSSKMANYFGIGSHSLGSSGSSITIASSPDNTNWTTIDTLTPTDDSPIMFLFANRTARYWRLSISGIVVPSVGVIYVGPVLEMIRPCFAGLSPINLSRVTVMRPNKSEGGQWIGRSVIRSGSTMKVQYNNLGGDWYRSYFDLFVKRAIYAPFFFAWRPSDYPDAIGYVSVDKDIIPTNSNSRDLMSVGFTMVGLSIE
jgi:hypothetical protein